MNKRYRKNVSVQVHFIQNYAFYGFRDKPDILGRNVQMWEWASEKIYNEDTQNDILKKIYTNVMIKKSNDIEFIDKPITKKCDEINDNNLVPTKNNVIENNISIHLTFKKFDHNKKIETSPGITNICANDITSKKIAHTN